MSARALLVLAIGLSSLTANSAFAATDLIWSNDRGFLPTNGCTITHKNETTFRVSHRSGSGTRTKSYENLRRRNGSVESYLLDGSLVKTISGTEKENYQYVEVVGVSQNGGRNPRGLSRRTDKGYLHDKSLMNVQDFVFEIMGDAPATFIGESRARLKGSFWQVAMSGENMLFAVCGSGSDAKDYLMFDVFIVERKEPIARVGVYWDETRILRSIRTFDPDEAEDKIERLLKSMDLRTNGGVSRNTTNGEDDDEDGEEDRVSQDELDINEETGEEDEEDDETQVHPDAHKPVDTELPPVEYRDLTLITCFDDGVLQVRDETLEKVLFTVERHEVAKPVQSWNQVAKTRKVNGRDVKFIEVQFPDRTGKNQGWIAEPFVLNRALCPSYQASLGSKQPIICTDSGSVRARGQDLTTTLFETRKFEAISLWTGSQVAGKKATVDGKTYEFIPVVFPERSNATGWVAKDFIKEKDQCEPYKKASAEDRGEAVTSINSGGCCVFPTIKRPTHSYLNGMRRFRANRSKGRRLHAACDLYRVHGEAAVSVAPGTVVRNKYYFYQGTYALEVKHAGGFIVRYGEITGKSVKGVTSGKAVKPGQTIGYIGTVNSGCCRPMLHFEMYSGKRKGALSVRGTKFQRRADLVDPTRDLRKWEKAKFGESY